MARAGTRRRVMRVQEGNVTMYYVILPYLRKELIESGSLQPLLYEGLPQLRDLCRESISSLKSALFPRLNNAQPPKSMHGGQAASCVN
jgi:hypothetical protein